MTGSGTLSTLATAAPAPTPAGQPHRYRLNRAGIHNVWQYDQVFEFGTGRLLLRGTNGAGKSKALEMLLPFLLDGDQRRIDSTGSGKTTLKWLMLDGYRAGTNRLGYLWVEFTREDEAGEEHLLTLGAVITASVSANKAEAEYFITDIPVGPRLPLHDRAHRPTAKELREIVGADCCFAQAGAFRAEVMRRLFGVAEAGKYRNLMHLLYQLRKPTVGDRVLAGQLTKVLDEALPPLDDDVIDNVARNLNDLEHVRAELARLEQTHAAVAEFLRSYRRYLHGVLRGRVGDVDGYLAELTRRRREAGDRQRELAALTEQENEAVAAAETAAEELETARGDLAALLRSAAYQALEDLREKQETVRALREGAGAAWQGLQRALEAERVQAAQLDREAEGVASDLVELRDHRHGVREAARRCGVDEALLGTFPQPTRVTLAAAASATLADPDRNTVPITRPAASGVPDTLAGELRESADALRGAERIRRDRARTTAEVRGLFARAAETRDLAQRREETAEQCEGRLAEAQDKRARHTARLLTEAQGYETALRAWVDALPAVSADDGRPITALSAVGAESEGEPADRVPGPDVADRVAEAAHALLDPRLGELDAERDRVLGDVRTTREEAARLTGELDDWENRPDPEPPRPDWALAPRPEGSGAPLYRLVDFADHLAPAERAGLEAALEASGLLAAWLDSAGRLRDADTRDLLLVGGRPVEGPSLADALRPVPTEAVGGDAVSAVLRGVALTGPTSAAEHRAGLDGSWRLGPLTGAHAKPEAEYVGAGVRAETRRRRIAELTTALETARTAAAEAAERLAAVDERRAELRRAVRALPSSRALVSAWEGFEQAGAGVEEAVGELRAARRQAEDARAEAARAQNRARAKAGAERLPEDADELAELETGLAQFASALETATRDTERLARRAADFPGYSAAWADARAAADTAESDYAPALSRLNTARRQLDLLESSLDEGEDELRRRETGIRERITECERREPGLRERARDLRDDRIKADGEHRRAVDTLRAQETSTIEGAARLLDPLRTTGVAAAAGIDTAADMVDRFEAAQDGQVRERIAALSRLSEQVSAALGRASADVSDNVLTNRGNELRQHLAGGYDAHQRFRHGIQTWELEDDTGLHDIASVGRRIEANLEADRERLSSREQEVFERYLLGELGDHLAHQLLQARQAVKRMNETLKNVRSSHGMGAAVEWNVAAEASPDVRRAIDLLAEDSTTRHPDNAARLRDALQRHIETVRQDDPTAGYGVHLREALDYRKWFEFQPFVLGSDGTSRRRFNHRTALSQGEQRVVSYLLLFAAAASHFDSLAEAAPYAPRLILLDDAFAKVDEPTHARLLGLLIDFDLDFVITSERLWGTFPNVDDLHIYECLRDPARRGVATVHFTWNGSERRLVSA